VLGLFNLRGQVVPLFDTARLVGTGSTANPAFAVVVNLPAGLAGLATDGLPRREVLDRSVGSSELPGTDGMYAAGGDVAVLLDLATLLVHETVAANGTAHG
jgi:chemotaxis signal transduction protein